ncbi:ribosome maturation factor RimM [Candidatus Raskinella chloraquaticus]|uniref:ribosome maturation factor RimM n=1 Tax=Candidatus Raskinella chloraquaticus TaxID=1951219 RepID=UPI00366F02A8
MSISAAPHEKRLVLAVIGKAHGVRGEVRVRSFVGDPADLGAYGPLSAGRGRSLTPQTIRVLRDGMAVVRFAGIEDRSGAEALNGLELSILRSALPAPDDEDTFYHTDLIGLSAVTSDGLTLGRIVAVHDFGAGDILEIRGEVGQAYYPFTKAVVPSLDLAAGRVVIIPPAETGTEEG